MTIEWQPIAGYEGVYEVGSHGRVRRLIGGRGASPGRVLALRPDRKGYLRVALHHGCRKDFGVHRLVAAAFLPDPDPRQDQVNHIDGDKANNAVSNLEWCTGKANIEHSHRIGLRTGIHRGMRSGRAKLTDAQVLEIRASTEFGKVLATRYGVSKSLIGAIRRREVWTHLPGARE